MNKPMKSSKHLAVGVAGGRISPSVSEADLTNPVESLKHDIDLLKTRVDRCNFKVSKAAESLKGERFIRLACNTNKIKTAWQAVQYVANCTICCDW
ncbi:hypothetical protein E2C01_097353 [Portunus trituberculatus]|uniref:Uncharacterized protein n=1 Tax=Portunus trituberculatus TaxID=210409 RepID=A0A5B7K9C6_PORTR|nr:hypothetical protein [Portunus trituberculatus]